MVSEDEEKIERRQVKAKQTRLPFLLLLKKLKFDYSSIDKKATTLSIIVESYTSSN